MFTKAFLNFYNKHFLLHLLSQLSISTMQSRDWLSSFTEASSFTHSCLLWQVRKSLITSRKSLQKYEHRVKLLGIASRWWNVFPLHIREEISHIRALALEDTGIKYLHLEEKLKFSERLYIGGIAGICRFIFEKLRKAVSTFGHIVGTDRKVSI